MKQSMTPREAAMESLLAIERDGKYSNLEVGAKLSRNGWSDADRGLYTRLVYGVTEKRITLDYAAGQYSDRMPETLDPVVRAAIRIGLYQLLYMDRIPPHAAVDESVRLVPRKASGYVNAVLRSFLRADGKVRWPDPEPADFALSVRASVPLSVARHFLRLLPREEAEAFFEAIDREPPVCLRANTLRLTAGEVADRFSGTVSSLATDIVLTDSFDDAVQVGVEKGDWFIQDAASRAATMAVGARPGETVVDTCACPGGKTFSMALDMRNEGRIFAFDLHRNKLSLIERGAERLGIRVIGTSERDARDPDPDLIGRADRVLCDAPCSGLGVLAKKPEIRYKELDETGRLPRIQYAILEGAAEYVRPGGVLVYSTCTLNPAENEEITARFLREHGDFSLTPDDTLLPAGERTFWPHRDGCDGFYCARMTKKTDE